jgi:filamentous hemagglutinin
VSDGSLVIRNKAQQQQEVTTLSRDTENANPGLKEVFDKDKEQNRLQEAQLIGQNVGHMSARRA